MKAKLIDLFKDYDRIARWWTERGLPIVPKVILPETGVIIEDKGVEFCAGWVYFHRTTLGVVDFITTNPAVSTSMAMAEALEVLLKFFDVEAGRIGCRALLSFVASDTGLHRFMVRRDWIDPRSTPHVYLYKTI